MILFCETPILHIDLSDPSWLKISTCLCNIYFITIALLTNPDLIVPYNYFDYIHIYISKN